MYVVHIVWECVCVCECLCFRHCMQCSMLIPKRSSLASAVLLQFSFFLFFLHFSSFRLVLINKIPKIPCKYSNWFWNNLKRTESVPNLTTEIRIATIRPFSSNFLCLFCCWLLLMFFSPFFFYLLCFSGFYIKSIFADNEWIEIATHKEYEKK